MVKGAVCLLNIRRILLHFECENGRSLTTVVLCYLLQTINYSDGFHLHEAYSSPTYPFFGQAWQFKGGNLMDRSL